MSRTGTGFSLRGLFLRREAGVSLLLLLCVSFVGLRNPDFLGWSNLWDILIRCAPVAIVASAVTLVMLTGEIDISVGSLMGVLAAVMGILVSPQRMDQPVWLGMVLPPLLGGAIGLGTGALVAYVRVPSIIVTLGLLSALRGATELLMDGRWITQIPSALRAPAIGSVFGVPVCVIVAAAVVAAVAVAARWTPFGLHVYATGSNPAAIRLAGVSARRVKLATFALSGFLTGIATIVSVPQLSVIEDGVGKGFELLVVTCVVVGGTSVSGGRGTVAGSALAVLLLCTIGTFLIFLKLGETATFWERAIQGAFILVAVLADRLTRKEGST